LFRPLSSYFLFCNNHHTTNIYTLSLHDALPISNVHWFSSYDDAIRQVNELPKATPLQHQTTYYGILIGPNGCGSLPLAVEVTVSLGVQELDLAQLSYYPNPADSELNISYIEEIYKVEIFHITGQIVLVKEFNSNEVKVGLSGLSS